MKCICTLSIKSAHNCIYSSKFVFLVKSKLVEILGGLAAVSVVGEEVYAAKLDIEAFFAIGIPFVSVPENKTGAMRKVLPESIGFDEHVANSQRLAVLIAGLVNRDYRLAGKAMNDTIVTPLRSEFIPCYNKLREAAFNAGGAGFAISGAGPSVIALADSETVSAEVAKAFSEVYSECGVSHLSTTAKPGQGAFIL
jgi:homoserine kinase